MIKIGYSAIALAIAFAFCLALVGCTSKSSITTTYDSKGNIIAVAEERDGRCIVQSHCTVFGIDLEIFDFMGNGSSSPSKIRLGYISSDNQVTPVGYDSSSKKIYTDVMGADKISVEQKTGGAK